MSETRPTPDSPNPRKPARRLVRAVKWITALIVFPILLGAVALSFLVNTSRFHSYLISTVQARASQALGVPVLLQNFTLHLSTLSIDLYGITVSGANAHPNPPLLQVQHVQAGVKVVSVLKRKWYLDSLRIDRPIIQILVDAHGVSNIPTLKSSGSGNNNAIFDLGIRRAVIDGGAVYYNDQPSALSADLNDVNLSAFFDPLQQRYSGTLGYSDGRFIYGAINPPVHSFNVQFDAAPNTLRLAPAKLIVGKSQLTLNATLVNYSDPTIQAQYNLTADGEEMSATFHNTSIPAGVVLASGSLQYHQIPNHPFLDSLQITGDLTSRRLDVRTPSARIPVADIVAHYSLAGGNATVPELRAHLLGGEVFAHGSMKNIAGDSHSQVDADVRGVSLAEVRRTFVRAPSMPDVDLTGSINGKASASWGKTIDDLIAHADAAIAGEVSGVAAPLQPQNAALPVSNPVTTNAIPVQSEIHASYTAKDQRLAVVKSFLHTPQTSLAIDGTVSHASNLNLQLQANDLREAELIADIFRTPTSGNPLKSLGLAGTAKFQGSLRGSTQTPHITGQLTAQNLQFNGTSWKVLTTNIDASSAQIALSHADLEPASHGKLTFNASAGLSQWTYSESSPLQIQLNASQLDIADLMKLAGQEIPVSGIFDANIALHGTQLNPIGNGTVNLTHVTAYGEPVTSAELTFTGTDNEAHGNLEVRAPAGALQSKFVIHPVQKSYSAELTSSGIHLEKIQSISTSEVSGVVTLSAKGEGTFANPQGDGVIEIPKLAVQNQTISDIKLHVSVANHVATANLTSSAVDTGIEAHAQVNLTGDFPADATLDTQSIPLGPLIAAYAPDEAAEVTGNTELHATLHGPLKDRQHLEAHATIPVLKLAYADNFQLAATAPIQIDYKNGVVNIERSTIRGTDTDLQFQGTIPTATDAPMSLFLVGTVNLHIAQLFSPDLKSSGEIKFNINSTRNVQTFDGSIDIVDANLSSPDLPVGLQHANGSLTLTKDHINITSLKGSLGGGALTAQGGIQFRPSVRFNLGLAAQGVRMLYPQGMRESMDADLRFTGSPQRALLGGSVNVTDLSFTPAFDLSTFIGQFTGGIAAPPSRGFAQNVALNLTVRSSNNVNLVSRTLSVGGAANLQLRGSLADPVILGRANLTGGDVIISDKRFVLTGGTIEFINPSETEPVVHLSLTTNIQQYNISLRFEGPIDQLRTQYTSDPSLPSADIINLLAFGKTTEASAADNTPTNQAAQSVVASQVSNQITSRVSKIAGISQLTINPVLPSQNTSGQAGANITIQQRVTSNLFITFSTNVASAQSQTIQGQYQVSPRVAISGTLDPNGGFGIDTLIKKSW
jgi:translocation and assembly module TamB